MERRGVPWVEAAVAAVVGFVIGAFATGQVGGVVAPLLFVLVCPLLVLFVRSSKLGSGSCGSSEELPPEHVEDAAGRTPVGR